MSLTKLELQIIMTPHSVNWTNQQTDPNLIHTCGGERKEGTTLDLYEPVKLLFSPDHAFNQGMGTPGQSEADETDFSQIRAKSTDLGIWICSII